MYNTLKIVGLLTLLTLILIAAARLFFGPEAVLPALLISLVMNFGAWWFSDRIALSFAGAKPVTEAEAPELYRIVGRVAETAGLPIPRVFVIDQPEIGRASCREKPKTSWKQFPRMKYGRQSYMILLMLC